ncbi:MAG: METTL5 family protein [Candidatus Saliniplasma sp.]
MTEIKKKHLEIKLEKTPSHPDPKPELEQYSTPSTIATDILFNAYLNRDIYGKKVLDLGCGTGIFSVGAALLGAEDVIGVDIDSKAIEVARNFAKTMELEDKIKLEIKDINDFKKCGDTVLMNPPFGAQKRGADTVFLKRAFESADRIYSLHNQKTEDYLRKFIKDRGFHIFWEKRYMYEIDKIFDFHTDESKNIDVILFAMERNELKS